MKRIILCVLFVMAVGGMLAAQNSGRPDSPRRNGEPEKISLSGSLALSRGRIVLESGGSTYYVAGIGGLIGFVEGLKEGASVSLEGWAFPLPRSEKEQIFRAAKLSFNGKDYELGGQERPPRNEFGFNRENRFGPPSRFDRASGFGHCGPQHPGPDSRGRKGRR
jgi:hypothetical protein